MPITLKVITQGKSMNISGIGQNLQLPATIDNGDVIVTKAYELKPQKDISGGENTPPAVIRHTSDDTPPSNGLKNAGIAEMYRQVSLLGRKETTAEHISRIEESFDIFTNQLAPIAVEMRRGLDQFIEELAEKKPDFASNNWGFSVAPDGYLVATEGLSQQEKTTLTELLNERDGLRLLANEFSKLVIKGMEIDRGPNKGTQGLGKYDLSAGNFSEVIDLREYLDSPFTGRNKQLYSSLVNKSDISSIYHIPGYFELAHQLADKAEVKYNKGIVDKYDFDTGNWHRVFGE